MSETLHLLLYSSLPSFFGISLNGFSTLQSVFVPAVLQTKYVNLFQVEYENKAIGFFFLFLSSEYSIIIASVVVFLIDQLLKFSFC